MVQKKNTSKNPLYVVTKKGTVVEEATSYLDAMVKKLNLKPVLDFLDWLIKAMLDLVKDYPTFIAIKNFFDLVMKRLELFIAYQV